MKGVRVAVSSGTEGPKPAEQKGLTTTKALVESVPETQESKGFTIPPGIGSGGVRDGVDLSDNAALAEVLGDDLYEATRLGIATW